MFIYVYDILNKILTLKLSLSLDMFLFGGAFSFSDIPVMKFYVFVKYN